MRSKEIEKSFNAEEEIAKNINAGMEIIGVLAGSVKPKRASGLLRRLIAARTAKIIYIYG